MMDLSQEALVDPSYRLGIGMMIVNQENKIFVGQRLNMAKESWQMPQGGIDLHENPDQALLRELTEEIGTKNIEVIARSKKWYQYDLPPQVQSRVWNGQFKGQKQLWYALRFKGTDAEINIHTSHPEFRDWKWVSKEELLNLIVFFKKDIYIQVLNEFWPFILKPR